jgi:hypothetical protein
MKKLGTFALLLSLSMLTIGCKPADTGGDAAPAGDAPAADAPAADAPAADEPAAE